MSYYSECYDVVKTVDVVVKLKVDGESATIRIEALLDLVSDSALYSVTSYKQEHVVLQPAYPADGNGPTLPTKTYQIWVDYDLPWVKEASADDAIRRALAFLSERCEGEGSNFPDRG